MLDDGGKILAGVAATTKSCTFHICIDVCPEFKSCAEDQGLELLGFRQSGHAVYGHRTGTLTCFVT